MTKYLAISSLLIGVSSMFAQNNSVVINNNAYIVLDGGTVGTPIYFVVNQPHQNGIITTGTGGNIISEDEYNIVKWNVGTSTGNYVVPFTTNNGASDQKIPYSTNITGAGTGAGSLETSTWETDDNNNAGFWPSDVSHLNEYITGTYNGPYVVDRFWHIDASGYGTEPTAMLSFMYNDVNEINGANLVTTANQNNLIAQRWDTGSEWDALAFGSYTAARTVSGVPVAGATFHDSWTLVHQDHLLPIELTNFKVQCENGVAQVIWTTASEINNDYFEVQKSSDGINWYTVGNVNGAGNSSSSIDYEYADYAPFGGTSFYRLMQYDYDGVSTTFESIAFENCGGETSVFAVDNTISSSIDLNLTSDIDTNFDVYIYDANGKLIVAHQNWLVSTGQNKLNFEKSKFAFGLYNVIIQNPNKLITTKLIVQ